MKNCATVTGTDGTKQMLCFICSPASNMLPCSVCLQKRPRREFMNPTKDTRRCNSCHTCNVCGKRKAGGSFEACVKSCRQCTPCRCDVCQTYKASSAFPQSQLQHATRNTYKRCLACHTCSQCKQFKEPERFHANETICLKCIPVECDVCRTWKVQSEFPESQLHHATRNSNLRCSACHICSQCKRVTSAEWFHENETVCWTCTSGMELYKCEVKTCAKKKLPASSFDYNVLKNHIYASKSAVCEHCQNRGYSPKDLNPHTCQHCKTDFGHTKFDPKMLWASKNNSGRLVCLKCATKVEASPELPTSGRKRKHPDEQVICRLHSETGVLLARAQFSTSNLKNHDNGKGFLYCSECAFTVNKLRERVQNTRNRCRCNKPIHQEPCPLTDKNTFPGRDLAGKQKLTFDEITFLNRLPRTVPGYGWWYKLWGVAPVRNPA